ncbi:hypothetical protein [Streptococcus cristatus]|uniref:hypothetical protein n=1 Tax=Streptococcus cristatus TaxID=45634 RepID=UPI001F48225D|nr:hypothetical protein [Streptococcus cristatus]
MMQQENKVLGILAIVFGAIALLGSWIPIINYLSFLSVLLLLFLVLSVSLLTQKARKLWLLLVLSFPSSL